MKTLFSFIAICLVIADGYSQTPQKKPADKPATGTSQAILIGNNLKPMRFGTVKTMKLPVLRRNSTMVQPLNARTVSGSTGSNTISRTRVATKEDRSAETKSVDEKGRYCTSSLVSEANGDYTKIVLGNQNDKIYPGAIYYDNSILDGAYNSPSLPLKPYDITLNLYGASASGSSMIRVQPSMGQVYDGISELMRRTSGVKNPSMVSIEVENIYTSEQLGFFLQADYQGYGVDLNAEFDYNKRQKSNLLFVKLHQVYFSVTMNRYRGDSLVSGNLPSNAVYVSKVNYGRIGIIRIETDSSAESIYGALDFAYNGSGNTVGAQVRARYERTLANCNIKGFFFGGDAANIVEISSSTNLAEFNRYVKNGLRLDPNVAPVPISYEMKFLNDNATAWTNSTTSFMAQDCVPARDLEITFNGVSVEDVHGGDCSYAWGKVDLQVWETENGIRKKRVMPIEGGVQKSESLMWNYPNGTQPQRGIINYAGIRNRQEVDMNQSGGKKWRFRIDPEKVAKNEVVIVVACDINTNHKDNDLASLGFHGMRRTEERSFKLNQVLIKQDDIRTEKGKYGSMTAGPFTSYSGSDRVHQFRAHFTVLPGN